MRKQIALAGAFIIVSGSCLAGTETLFTSPFLVVSPKTLEFGALRPGEFATNCFLVENVGSGTLAGQATVAPPFRIQSGASYKLTRNGAEVVTIVYTPDGAPTNTQVVTFTGGTSEVKATVTGSLSTKRWPYYLKRKK